MSLATASSGFFVGQENARMKMKMGVDSKYPELLAIAKVKGGKRAEKKRKKRKHTYRIITGLGQKERGLACRYRCCDLKNQRSHVEAQGKTREVLPHMQ